MDSYQELVDGYKAFRQKYLGQYFEEQCQVCEMEGALVSLGNLTQYPYVRAAMENGKLNLHD